MLFIDTVALYPEDHERHLSAPQAKVLVKGMVHFLSQRPKWPRELKIDL